MAAGTNFRITQRTAAMSLILVCASTYGGSTALLSTIQAASIIVNGSWSDSSHSEWREFVSYSNYTTNKSLRFSKFVFYPDYQCGIGGVFIVVVLEFCLDWCHKSCTIVDVFDRVGPFSSAHCACVWPERWQLQCWTITCDSSNIEFH